MENTSVRQAYAIETEGLTKYYGDFEAVRGLTMRVPKGTITGFLGQNGAGKSSTIKMFALWATQRFSASGCQKGHRLEACYFCDGSEHARFETRHPP